MRFRVFRKISIWGKTLYTPPCAAPSPAPTKEPRARSTWMPVDRLHSTSRAHYSACSRAAHLAMNRAAQVPTASRRSWMLGHRRPQHYDSTFNTASVQQIEIVLQLQQDVAKKVSHQMHISAFVYIELSITPQAGHASRLP